MGYRMLIKAFGCICWICECLSKTLHYKNTIYIRCSFCVRNLHGFHILAIHEYQYNRICDWLWENPPVTHKDNYLEKRN